ncbi:tetratricopeptide repeat protein [Rhodohalobacter sp. 8-1]|uniref:tetratricopeptide repeat protein n=1 Tax=Rhodohalobacter sp. 8-1 TaxID=3131972 RepID=UPI0030EC7269
MIPAIGSFGNEELVSSEKSNAHTIASSSMIQINKIAGLLFFVIILSAGVAHAQTPILIHDNEFRQDAVTAIDSLYNRNTEASQEIMADWEDRYPDHPLWEMWNAMEVWWVVLEDLYDHSHDDRLMEALHRSDYAAGQLLNRQPNHPDALIIRALANGYIARHYSNRDSWLSSVNVSRKAYSTYQTLMEVEPDFPDNEFVQGMISYYAAYIPEEYPVVRAVSWFFPDGDKEEGLRKIRIASDEGIFSRPEATYFMGNILLNYENEVEEAMGYFRRLVNRYPDNGYYRRLMIRTLSSQNRNEDVLAAVDEALNHWEDKDEASQLILQEELLFWKGRAYYRMNQFQAALKSFQEAISHGEELPNRPERLYYSVANYYAGLSSEALQNPESAKKYYSVTVDQDVEGDFMAKARERLGNL